MKEERYRNEALVYKIKNKRDATKVFIKCTPERTNLFWTIGHDSMK
jgi:hypothetical protein